ncbi:MAG: metal-dependent transcriptional regulator [bacterium]
MTEPARNLLVAFSAVLVAWFLFRPDRGLIPAWLRQRRLAGRVLREDALKHVWKEHDEGRTATVASLAGALSISTDDAAGLVGQMQEHGLLLPTEGGFDPTPAGRDYALQIIRAHRLWERFLADHTGIRASEWHGAAERREHAMTPGEADALAAHLGDPRFDPHGDPIPTAAGEMMVPESVPLHAAEIDEPLQIVHLEDEPETVYAQLAAEGLHVGMMVRVVESTPARVRFWADGDEHVLAPVLAANVSVAPAEEEDDDRLPGDMPSERLSSLTLGESAEILFVSRACRGLERRRLMDLGIVPGTRIEAVLASPTGDPIAYRVRGTTVAIRRDQSRHIHIRPPVQEVAS